LATILATGGLGFVGSHACITLIENGFNVVIVDSLVNSSEKRYINLKKILEKLEKNYSGKINLVKGDIRDRKLLNNIFKEYKNNNNKISAVFHFAGLKSVSNSFKNPIEYWDTNLNSTLSLLSEMEKNECYSIVFSSSATIYKPKNEVKFSEIDLKEPINPYGNTKLSIERLLEDVFKTNPNNWRVVNLRYFNPAGAHPSSLIGEIPMKKSSNLFPEIMKVLLGNLDCLPIYGNDWPTNDGTCIRDFIHVMDLAEAHLAALNFLLNNDPQIISFNVGTGKGISVLEVVNNFKKMNIKLPHEFTKRREGDFYYLVSDNSFALKRLNWRPERTLDDICIDCLNWLSYFKENYL